MRIQLQPHWLHRQVDMFLVYYFVMAAIAFWAISTHPQTSGRPFLSLVGAMIVPLALPLVPIIGLVYWAHAQLKTRQMLTTDEGIRALILGSVKHGGRRISAPNLRYERVSDFAEAHGGSREYFPNYTGMRFWIGIQGGAYFVEVETIDPSKADESGVVVTSEKVDSVL